jgi:hypothetical protein
MCGALEVHVGRQEGFLVAPQVAARCHGWLQSKDVIGLKVGNSCG